MTTELLNTSAGAEQDPCPSCGGRLGGRTGCQGAFDQLSAAAWTSSGRATVHNLAVDTYAMQHPEDYCLSPKSYAAHLIALCCGLENPGDQKLYWEIPRWLDGPARIEKPSVISRRGDISIADVIVHRDDNEYPEVVRQWAPN